MAEEEAQSANVMRARYADSVQVYVNRGATAYCRLLVLRQENTKEGVPQNWSRLLYGDKMFM